MKAVIAALALAAVAQAAIPRAQPVGCDSWTMFGGNCDIPKMCSSAKVLGAAAAAAAAAPALPALPDIPADAAPEVNAGAANEGALGNGGFLGNEGFLGNLGGANDGVLGNDGFMDNNGAMSTRDAPTECADEGLNLDALTGGESLQELIANGKLKGLLDAFFSSENPADSTDLEEIIYGLLPCENLKHVCEHMRSCGLFEASGPFDACPDKVSLVRRSAGYMDCALAAGDGICDMECNIPEFSMDGGDC